MFANLIIKRLQSSLDKSDFKSFDYLMNIGLQYNLFCVNYYEIYLD